MPRFNDNGAFFNSQEILFNGVISLEDHLVLSLTSNNSVHFITHESSDTILGLSVSLADPYLTNLGTIKFENCYEYYKSKLIDYFKDQPNINLLLEAICNQGQEIFDQIFELYNQRILTTARGVNLDNIGQIVGQLRDYKATIEDPNQFGFDGDNFSKEFGDINDADLGGRWKSLGDLDRSSEGKLGDDHYLKAIYAKIHKNFGSGTPEELIYIVKQLTGATKVKIIENESDTPAAVSVYLEGIFEDGLLPFVEGIIRDCTPVGVKLDQFTTI